MHIVTSPKDMSQQHVDALTWASWDFNVGPLNGKIPLTPHGHKDFTRNIAQIDQWWSRWPDANIGARVFKGHVVIDIDPRNGGDDTWEQISRGRELPTTLITRTGSGGRHIWFKLPTDRPVKGKAGEGIDIKHHGGYLVMPGSVHPKTGGLYVCEQWAVPAKLPKFLEPHVYRPVPKPAAPKKYKTGDGSNFVNFVLRMAEGERHEKLIWAARKASENGLDIRQELLDAATSIGYPENHARRDIREGHQYGLNNPKGAAA